MHQICFAIETGKEKETQQEIHLCKVKWWCTESGKLWALIQGDLFITLWHLGSPCFTTQPDVYQVGSLSFLPDKAGRDCATPRPISSLLSCFPWPWSDTILGDNAAKAYGKPDLSYQCEGGHGGGGEQEGQWECSFTSRWPWLCVKRQEELPGPCSLFLSSTSWLTLSIEQLL